MKFNANVKVLGRLTAHKSPWQENVLDRQIDATLDPGASPTAGDRYLIENSAALHANFGTITGVGDDDIVEYTGSAFEIVWDASANGEGAKVYVEDENSFYSFNGTAWNLDTSADESVKVSGNDTTTGYLEDKVTSNDSSITISTLNDGSDEDLNIVVNEANVDHDSLQNFVANEHIDHSGVSITAGNGLSGGGDITTTRSLAVDPATEVAGSRAAVYVDTDGVGVDLDNATLTHTTSTLQVKDGGIGATQLASGVLKRFTTATHSAGTAVAINHALGLSAPSAVHISMFDATSGEPVFCDDVDFTDGNNLTLNFASSVGANELRINISSAEDIA